MCDLTNVQDRASGIKNIKNAKEWEKRSSVFLQFNGSCAVPFPPRYLVQRAIYTSGYTFQLSGIRLKFWARNEGRGKGGNRGCGDKKVGSFESVRFDSIRFGGKNGIDEGKKLFRNGNNGEWNALLREMRLKEASEQRFLITISKRDTPENIYPKIFIVNEIFIFTSLQKLF